MKKLILALLVFTATTNYAFAESRAALAGSEQKAREIHWAWRYMKDFSLSCLESKTECLQPDVREMVTKLSTYAPEYNSSSEISWANLLQFVSETVRPDLFKSTEGEVHRVAATELKMNSVVYINTDRMKGLELRDWIGILAHEMLHHLGYKDDQLRTLDKVGAELAKHFQRRALLSNFEQYGRPDLINLIFNSNATNRLSLGMLTWPDGTYDIEWGNSVEATLCNTNETPVKQFVGSPTWRINRIQVKRGIVTAHGGGFVNALCQDKVTAQQRVNRLMIYEGIDLQFKAPLQLRDWQNETPSVIPETIQITTSSNPADVVWSPNQSFVVVSLKNENEVLRAGDTWKAQIILQSLDEKFQPTTCEVFYTGTEWSFWKQNRLPALAQFRSCAFKGIGNGQFQIDIETTFPFNMRPDDFYIPLIRFPSANGDRFAVPTHPQFINVKNPEALPPPVFESYSVQGLANETEYKGDKLEESYRARAGDVFTVDLIIKGPHQMSDVQLDIEFWSLRPDGNVGRLFYSGPATDMQQIITKTEILKNGDVTTVRLTVKMPATLVGYGIEAMRFTRFYMRSSDYSWVELENTTFNNGVIVREK
jgi:hypothetical protein